MIAVSVGFAAVADILASSNAFTSLSIACYNSAAQCVVSGPIDGLNALKQYLHNKHNCKSVILAVPFAFHSPTMHPILDDLITVAGRLSFSPPTIPVLSGVHGTVVLPGDALTFNAHYIARHCAEPVMFDEGISASLGIPEFANATA